MKRYMFVALGAMSLGGLVLLTPPSAEAQGCCPACPHHGAMTRAPQDPQPGPGGPRGAPNYDVDTVTTLRGTAGSVNVVPARGGRMGGMHLTLQAPGQTMEVHLGPTWFLQREGVELAKGDAIEVTGSVVELEGATLLIARELKKGAKVVVLRDEQGIPAWSGVHRP